MTISILPAILKSSFRPPAGTSWTAVDDAGGYYCSWGFTIYRTAYGPATNAQWRTLLDKIRAQAVSEIDGYVEAGEEDVAAQLKSLFVLDARSDAALLADKTMDEVREIYKQVAVANRSSGDDYDNDNRQSVPLMHDGPNQHAFLLADAEVLEGVDRDPYFWVKCADVDFVERDLARTDGAPEARGSVAQQPGCDLASIAPGARAADERPVYNGELTGSSLTSKMSSGK
ncbi:hypothetical protein K4K58_001882 [Colletotrichum sp. SAR11_239]|nr:hypothetical protein K4K58_001882 [Colletotrichum sp. SAR11_239]